MWQEDRPGSTTPPVPTRNPPPPPPDLNRAFLRSHSLGKTEAKLSYEAATNDLLGRHTHGHHGLQPEPVDLQRIEFEELRARCAQMEKTMRWWSECTANWRDKWSKVRAERNRFKDDLKRLSIKHEAALENLNRQLQMPEVGLKVRNYYPGGRDSKTYRVQAVQTELEASAHAGGGKDVSVNTTCLDMSVMSFNLPFNIDQQQQQSIDDCGDSGVFHVKASSSSISPNSDRMKRFLNDVSAMQSSEQATMIQFRLDEALKTLEAERKDKDSLQNEIEVLQNQVGSLEASCDELNLSKSDLTRDFASLRIDYADHVKEYARQVDDSVSAKHNLEQMVGHLREELERLQAENAEEWGRRERLETEKQATERQNKKLKAQNEELRERVDRLSSHNSYQNSNEMTKLQAELDKHKCELADLKHVNSKLRKNNTDKSEELDHRQRKGETSDKEVRALRLRIEQLKSELGEAQDDIDSSTTTNRRLERTNDELNGQLESLQVQVGHLTSRLRSVPTDILSFRRMSRVSAPGGIMSSGFNVLQDVEDTSTDENEFSYAGDEEEDEEDEMVHETDV